MLTRRLEQTHKATKNFKKWSFTLQYWSPKCVFTNVEKVKISVEISIFKIAPIDSPNKTEQQSFLVQIFFPNEHSK